MADPWSGAHGSAFTRLFRYAFDSPVTWNCKSFSLAISSRCLHSFGSEYFAVFADSSYWISSGIPLVRRRLCHRFRRERSMGLSNLHLSKGNTPVATDLELADDSYLLSAQI